MRRCTGGVINGSTSSTSAPASHPPSTSVTQCVSRKIVLNPTSAAARAATVATAIFIRRPAGAPIITRTPNTTTAFEACPDGKMLPPSKMVWARCVALGPSRPVPSLTAPTLTLRISNASANIVTGRQLRIR